MVPGAALLRPLTSGTLFASRKLPIKGLYTCHRDLL